MQIQVGLQGERMAANTPPPSVFFALAHVHADFFFCGLAPAALASFFFSGASNPLRLFLFRVHSPLNRCVFKLRTVICGACSHTEQACYVSTSPAPTSTAHTFPTCAQIRSGKDLSSGGIKRFYLQCLGLKIKKFCLLL